LFVELHTILYKLLTNPFQMFRKFTTLAVLTLTLTACSMSSSVVTNEGTPTIVTTDIQENGDLNPTLTMHTNYGDIVTEMYQNEVPEMAKNFLELAKAGNYNDVPFHRIIPGFVVQGGDFTNKNGSGGHSYLGEGTVIDGEYDETVSSNLRGTLSYANRGPETNGSQFFINLQDNIGLDHDKEPLTSQHPVFGKVVEGMDVVDKIAEYTPGS
jgi:peptidyl-prolyl cis-trans isomerase B (cyclophilin B)